MTIMFYLGLKEELTKPKFRRFDVSSLIGGDDAENNGGSKDDGGNGDHRRPDSNDNSSSIQSGILFTKSIVST